MIDLPLSGRSRYVFAVVIAAAGVASLVLFHDFFDRSPLTPAWCVSLICLLVAGVGPAILAEVIIILATVDFAIEPFGVIRLSVPGDIARLVIFVGCVGLADFLAWRLQRARGISARHERALRQSEARFRHLLEQASDGIVLAQLNGSLLMVNRRACEMLGYTEAELLRIPLTAVYAPGELERLAPRWDLLPPAAVVLRERRLVRKDGSAFDAELSVRRTEEGLIQAIIRDISERRHAEEARRAEHEMLDKILATSVAGILVTTPEGKVVFLNRTAEEALGITRTELGDRTELPSGWRFLTVDGEPLPDSARPSRYVVRTGQPIQDFRMVVERPDGQQRILSVNAAPLRDRARRLTAVVLSLSDISEQFGAQKALREREEQLERITSAVPGVVYQYVVGPDGDGRFAYVSRRVRELLGVGADEILEDPARLAAVVDPDDRAAATPLFQRATRSLEPLSFDFRVRNEGSGPPRWLRAIATPVREQDAVIWNGVVVDITDQRRLQEELLQSQKMDSLGRLAGGVAHDFNNLLTVIRGYADVLTGELSAEDPRLDEVREIRRAAERATSLTRQLLAMSRRQMLVPREVELNGLVEEMERMLRRVIGADITIVLSAAEDVGWVRADPGQLEQVVLNLAVNARDAMPDGGTLTIETRRVVIASGRQDAAARGVPPGDYAVLRVSDTGSGMDADTQSKIFEPFFTTKPVGEGTGLGLSTVYGIVQQSRGLITVESGPGAGTSFRIFLPRIPEPAHVPGASPSRIRRRPGERRATVLLVEDDEGVRQLTGRILEEFGFGVVQAEDGKQALALLADGTRVVDAVVSDVVMPGMSGTDLVGRLRSQRPDLPVLLLSGFTGDEVVESVRPEGHARQAFLQKPFSPDALATALEALLADSARGIGSP